MTGELTSLPDIEVDMISFKSSLTGFSSDSKNSLLD